jgi:hypothetical protein
MKLVEAEAEGPVEGDDAVVTPPRPPHRRVSVSLLFTLIVLVGTVVTIYTVFPARHNVLVTVALERHRDVEPAWDLTGPSPGELHAWAIAVVGKDVPLPQPAIVVLGARDIEVLNRRAAVIRVQIGSDEVTYIVQHARGIAPEHSERVDGELFAVAWRHGPFTCVAVGPDHTHASWVAAIKR